MNSRIHGMMIMSPDDLLGGSGGGSGGGGGSGPGEGGGQNGGQGAGGSGNSDPNGGGANSGGMEAIGYPSDLDAAYHGNAHLLKFWDKEKKAFKVGELMKSSIHAQHQIGKDKFVIPGQTSTPEEWNQVFRKLGLPETEDKYELKNNLPQGMKEDPELLKAFRSAAFKAGVLPRQAQTMMDTYNTYIGEVIKSQNVEMEKTLVTEQNGLKTEWGGQFKGKVRAIDALMTELLPAEHMSALRDQGFLKSTAFVRLMDSVVKSMGKEGSFNDGEGGSGLTAAQIDEKVRQMHQPSSPLMNKTHPHYASARAEYDSLMRQKVAMRKFREQA